MTGMMGYVAGRRTLTGVRRTIIKIRYPGWPLIVQDILRARPRAANFLPDHAVVMKIIKKCISGMGTPCIKCYSLLRRRRIASNYTTSPPCSWEMNAASRRVYAGGREGCHLAKGGLDFSDWTFHTNRCDKIDTHHWLGCTRVLRFAEYVGGSWM